MKKLQKYLFIFGLMAINVNKTFAYDGIMTLSTYKKFVCVDSEMPLIFPQIVHILINIIEIIVPVLIVIYGMFDFAKAVMAQKDDDIKKAKQNFVKRLALGFLLFLVVVIVRMIISFVASGEETKAINQCFNCFINGKC